MGNVRMEDIISDLIRTVHFHQGLKGVHWRDALWIVLSGKTPWLEVRPHGQVRHLPDLGPKLRSGRVKLECM